MVFFIKSGRGERIRTFDTLVPNQVLYQTELHPESETYYNPNFIKSKYIFLSRFFLDKLYNFYSINPKEVKINE